MANKSLELASEQVAVVVRASVEGVMDVLAPHFGIEAEQTEQSFRVLWAESLIASDKPKKDLTDRETKLVQMQRTVTAVTAAGKRGDIINAGDSKMLSQVFMESDVNPTSMLRYLSGTVPSVERKLSANELVGAVMTWQEINDGFFNISSPVFGSYKGIEDSVEVIPSVALVINAADFCGTNLADICDEDINMIAVAIDKQPFVRVIERDDINGDPFKSYQAINTLKLIPGILGFAPAYSGEVVQEEAQARYDAADASYATY